MKIYRSTNLKNQHCKGVLAIGNFDGVHLGHQKVIRDAKQQANKNKLPFGIMTFEPMPVMFFNKKIKNHRINSLDQKINQFKKLKIDFLIIRKFNKKFSRLTAEKFIEQIIFKKTKCKYLYVSNNFRFGFKRKGNIRTLKKFGKKFNYRNLIIKPLKKKIREGKIKEANKLLNRNWSVDGKVIKGRKRGRKIGFPTCNLKMGNYVIPRLGVYAVKVKTSDFNKNGVANVGYRPTFNGQNLLLETNIFGINRNLYNKVISVSFKKFIRPEKKFKNLNYLKKQIKFDIKKAKNV